MLLGLYTALEKISKDNKGSHHSGKIFGSIVGGGIGHDLSTIIANKKVDNYASVTSKNKIERILERQAIRKGLNYKPKLRTPIKIPNFKAHTIPGMALGTAIGSSLGYMLDKHRDKAG